MLSRGSKSWGNLGNLAGEAPSQMEPSVGTVRALRALSYSRPFASSVVVHPACVWAFVSTNKNKFSHNVAKLFFLMKQEAQHLDAKRNPCRQDLVSSFVVARKK